MVVRGTILVLELLYDNRISRKRSVKSKRTGAVYERAHLDIYQVDRCRPVIATGCDMQGYKIITFNQNTSRNVLSGLKYEAIAECFRLDRTRAASFLDGCKNKPSYEFIGKVILRISLVRDVKSVFLTYEKLTSYFCFIFINH